MQERTKCKSRRASTKKDGPSRTSQTKTARTSRVPPGCGEDYREFSNAKPERSGWERARPIHWEHDLSATPQSASHREASGVSGDCTHCNAKDSPQSPRYP